MAFGNSLPSWMNSATKIYSQPSTSEWRTDRPTDRQTNRQTDFNFIYIYIYTHKAVMISWRRWPQVSRVTSRSSGGSMGRSDHQVALDGYWIHNEVNIPRRILCSRLGEHRRHGRWPWRGDRGGGTKGGETTGVHAGMCIHAYSHGGLLVHKYSRLNLEVDI